MLDSLPGEVRAGGGGAPEPGTPCAPSLLGGSPEPDHPARLIMLLRGLPMPVASRAEVMDAVSAAGTRVPVP